VINDKKKLDTIQTQPAEYRTLVRSDCSDNQNLRIALDFAMWVRDTTNESNKGGHRFHKDLDAMVEQSYKRGINAQDVWCCPEVYGCKEACPSSAPKIQLSFQQSFNFQSLHNTILNPTSPSWDMRQRVGCLKATYQVPSRVWQEPWLQHCPHMASAFCITLVVAGKLS